MSAVRSEVKPRITHRAPPPPYAFLAQPPPQKKRPTQALPSPPTGAPPSPPRRRSNTVSAITSWAQHVQPGSPAPRSPRRRPSVTSSRRPSISRSRRPSITSIRLTSGSFLNILDTPSTARRTTPSIKDFNADLTTVGYTSVFVHLPNVPFSATLPVMPKKSTTTPIVDNTNTNNYSHIPVPPIPASPTKNTRTIKRFRSLSILRSRPRSKSTATSSSPTKSKMSKAKPSAKASAIVKHKKAKYANLRPAPLANDLALMQFADGGDMDSHIKRVMEAQAKAAAVGGVGDVYRDGQGGIWWDADEEWEYAHLLGGEEQVSTDEMDWVQFGDERKAAGGAVDDDVRRGSVSTMSSQDSDLNPVYVVQPAEEQDDLAAYGSALAPMALHRPGASVLSHSVRHNRGTAKHLRKPEYLLDIAFPRGNPESPKTPRFYANVCPSSLTTKVKPKGPARRRPAPLKLSPPSPALKRPTNSPVDPEKVRKDFLDSSFAPAPASVSPTLATRGRQGRKTSKDSSSSGATVTLARRAIAGKASIMSVKAFFRSGRKEEMQDYSI